MTHIEDDWARWRQETPFDQWFDAKGYDQNVDAHRGHLRAAWFAAVRECVNCYSPDDSADDWADKMRRMIEP